MLVNFTHKSPIEHAAAATPVRRLPEQRRAEAQLREDLLLHRDDGLEKKWQNLDEKWWRKSLKMMNMLIFQITKTTIQPNQV